MAPIGFADVFERGPPPCLLVADRGGVRSRITEGRPWTFLVVVYETGVLLC